MASGVKGVPGIRNLLKRLPDAAAQEMVVELNLTGRDIAAEMRRRAPFGKTGNLKAGISYKVLPRSLKLQVGLLGTPSGRAKLFYGRILDLGRKARTVIAHRLHRGGRSAWTGMIRAGTARAASKPSELVSTYTMNVRPIRAMRFVTGSYSILRKRLGDNLRGIWDRVLRKASAGAGGGE